MEELTNNPRIIYTLKSNKVPELDIPSNSYGLETILNKNSYYSRLRLNKNTRPKTVLKFSAGSIEPKPGREVALDLYYQNEGSFLEGENYGTSGELKVQDSILKLKSKLDKKLIEGEVIDKIENLVCKENSPGDWSNLSHQATLMKEHVPKHLKHKQTNIIKQVTCAGQGFLSLHLKEAKERLCIVINGDGGTGKTRLAEELIVPRLAEQGVILTSKSYAKGEEQDLTDKLERIDGTEVILLDDYSGENHKLGVLNKLTSSSNVSKIRVMGNHQSTRYIKGVLIPTTDSVETWINNKTGTLRKFIQILRRTNATFYIFNYKHTKEVTGESYKNRIIYVGNVRQGIYDTITKALPSLVDEPLGAYHKDTQLAKDLDKLFHKVVNSLYNDKNYGDGEFTGDRVPYRFWNYLPELHKGAVPGIIQMFKLPNYEWLRDKVNSLRNPDLNLPPLTNDSKKIEENHKNDKITTASTRTITV